MQALVASGVLHATEAGGLGLPVANLTDADADAAASIFGPSISDDADADRNSAGGYAQVTAQWARRWSDLDRGRVLADAPGPVRLCLILC